MDLDGFSICQERHYRMDGPLGQTRLEIGSRHPSSEQRIVTSVAKRGRRSCPNRMALSESSQRLLLNEGADALATRGIYNRRHQNDALKSWSQ
jgi:hypothetical protein